MPIACEGLKVQRRDRCLFLIPTLEGKPHKGGDLSVLPLLYPQYFNQCLALDRRFLNICWMNK